MRYEREIRTRGERLFDRPSLAPGLAELSPRVFTRSTCIKPFYLVFAEALPFSYIEL